MARYAKWGLLVVVVLCLAPSARAGSIYQIDYATYDVRVTDKKGVVTDAEEFGFYAGPNILNAKRGDGEVQIPFRKIRLIEIGTYIPSKGYYPCSVTSRRNKVFQVELERIEGQRYMGGSTDVGSFRVRLGLIKRLELLRLSHSDDL